MTTLLSRLPQTAPRIPCAVPPDLVYDDESLEGILYGEVAAQPTPACIRTVEPNPLMLAMLIHAKDSPALDRYFQDIGRQFEAGRPFSLELVAGLVAATRQLLPSWPQALKAPLPKCGGEFLETLWRACVARDEASADIVGSVLWEWYEYAGRSAAARTILSRLVDSSQRAGKFDKASLLLNQLAYQWLLERDWTTAQASYETAAEAAAACQSRRNWLIARLGWWVARFEQEPEAAARPLLAELDALIPELVEQRLEMQLRKAQVYLARCEALVGNLAQAVRRLDQAIEIDRRQQAIYLGEDLALQETMRAKLGTYT